MATIQNSIKLFDGMTPALKSMHRSVSILISAFTEMQSATGKGVDTSKIRAASYEMRQVGVQINRIEAELNRAENKQKRLNAAAREGGQTYAGLVGKVKTFGAALAASVAARTFIQTSDAAVTTTAKLGLINDGLQTTEALQQKIYSSAQEARSSYTDTAAVVSKLGILAGEAFASNDEMIFFAEQMNKQFKIGGASVQEQTSAMYQLTQAMAAGRLQGDEFRSIMENAPLLAKSIANEFGVSVGELREMSSEGLVTAEVIKNAMVRSAEETNAKFAQLPMTFAQLWTQSVNWVQNALRPLFLFAAQGAQWISDNWSVIAPVFVGLAAAALAYAVALGIQTTATWIATGAAKAFFTTLLSNPLFWVVLIIGVIIGAIYKWIKAVGGIKIAWMMVTNALLIAWDWVKIGFFTGIYFVMDLLDKLKIKFATIAVKSTTAMWDMKVGVLLALQRLVNGAIDIINAFISKLNKIKFISIETIGKVSFGTNAAIENEAKKQAVEAGLEAYKTELEARQEARALKLRDMQVQAVEAAAERQSKIDAARASAESKDREKGATSVTTGESASIPQLDEIAGNTGAIKDAVTLSAEELKYMRDLAEQEVINRFTTAEIKVDMHNQNAISSEMDIDGVISQLEDKLTETLNSVAEGVAIGV